MKRIRPLLAAILALALVAAPLSPVWAGKDDPTDATGANPIDSGHPWDDEAENSGDPDNPDNTTAAMNSFNRDDSRSYFRSSVQVVSVSGSRALGDAVLYAWHHVVMARIVTKMKLMAFWR